MRSLTAKPTSNCDPLFFDLHLPTAFTCFEERPWWCYRELNQKLSTVVRVGITFQVIRTVEQIKELGNPDSYVVV